MDTKPVQMMNLEAMFCMGNIDSINCKVIELPFQNKHLSMLILLPKDVEDESTGLEKVRKEHQGTLCVGRAVWSALCGAVFLMPHLLCHFQGFAVLSGPFSLMLKQPTFIWHLQCVQNVNSLCALPHLTLTTSLGIRNYYHSRSQ